MKTQTAILVVLVALLLGSTALAQSGGPSRASWYTIQAGTAAGGSYQLASLSWRVSGLAGGGPYRLTVADRSAGGNQCCCTYLPIILRNF